MKILLVDDDKNFRAVLRLIVEDQGHEVIEAGDGQEGLAKAVRNKPDAIISDALMPKMDGFQFLRAIRRNEALGTIPFVLHTAIYTENKERELALSLGADALIAKPKSPDDFWQEFSAALDAHASKQRQTARMTSLKREDEELRDYCRIVASKLETKVRELETTIADHVRIKKVLQESEERYRLLFENNPHPMWVFDLETLAFLAVNEAAVSKYGYSREEFLGMTIKDIRPSDDIPALLDKISKFTEGIDDAGAWRHRKKDGTIIDVEITAHSLDFGGRRAELVLAIDVTGRRLTEENIRNAAGEWRKTFDAISDLIALLDKEGNILRCNRAMAFFVGQEFQDIIGRHCREILRGAAEPVEESPFEIARRTHKREFLVLPLGGRWFEISAEPYFDNSGKFSGAVHIMKDITERRHAEEILKASEEKYRTLIESANDAIFILDLKGNFIDINTIAYERLGYTKEEMLSKHVSLFDTPEFALRVPERMEQVQKYGKAVFESAHLKKDGSVMPVEINARIINFEGKKALCSIIRDITERKRSEDLINKIAQQQRAILNNIPDIAWLKDKENRFIAVNEPFGRVSGLKPDDLVGKTDLDIWPQELAERYWADDQEVMLSGKQKVVEEPLADKEGKTAWIETIKTPIYDEKGVVIGTTGIARDITTRKKAGEALRASEEMHRTYLDIAGVLIVALDAEGRVALVNKKGLEITGYEEQEMIGRSWFDLCIPGPMREKVRSVFNSLMTGGMKPVEYFENTILRKDGSERVLAFHNAAIRTESGDISGILSSGQDITEQKWAHDQLNQRAHQAALGAEVGAALTRGGDLRATLQRCAEAMTQHLSAAFSRIWTLNERENVLELQASAGMYTHINGAHGRVPVGKFKIGRIAEERKPHLTNQVIGDPRVWDQEWAKKEGMVAFAGYPLIVQDRLVGVMALFSRSQIPEATMSSLASVADVIALGIERKWTEDELEQYGKQLTALNTASNTLLASTSLKEIYQEICKIIYSVLDVKMVWLGIIGPEGFDVTPVAYAGQEDGYLAAIKVTWDDYSPTGRGPSGLAIKTRKPFVVNIDDPSFAPWQAEAKNRGYASSMAVPLLPTRGDCIGVLNFFGGADSFTPDSMKLTQIFANQAAIAIENARLIEGLEGKVTERTRQIEDTNIELQSVNRELEQRREEAESGSRSKSEFLANMSHELRTPLNAVIGLSQVLLEQTFGPLNAKQSEYLDGVRQSGNHLLSLINEILDLSKIEAGKEQFEPAVFSMPETLRNAFMMVKEKAMKHGIELSQEIGPEVGLFYADERRIKQILFNLLSNAVKFTETGGKVGLKAHMDERALTLIVWDTGVGIPENKRHLIFQPFQQVDSSLSKKHEGTGLGLALSKRLVEMHGGTITFESRESAGTSFTVTLPVMVAEKNGAPQGIEEFRVVRQSEGGAPRGKKVLVVEDNQLNMLLAADFLETMGFTVVEAANGEVALEKAAQERPDVILLDIQMPGIDGFEVIRRLRENVALKDIPVIAMTALAMKGDEERCMRAGFNDYISKPVNLNEMFSKIDRSFGRGDKNE